MAQRLSGKTAMVTGAGSGNGRAIALRLAAEGARVAVADLRVDWGSQTVETIVEAGGSALFVKADVSISAEVDAAVASAAEWGQGLDIMVNNAGINLRNELVNIDPAQWKAVIDVNLKGVFCGIRAAGRRMVQDGKRGKIINISSIREEVAGFGNTAYCASKGGVRMLTRAAALEFAPHGICVNAIGPGYVETNLTRPLLANPQALKRIVESVPWGRLAVPEEVAAVAAFLASPDSDYITGTTIFVDGGHLTG